MCSQSRDEEAGVGVVGGGSWVCGLAFSFLGHRLVVGFAGFCHCVAAPTSPFFLYSAANTEGLWYRRGAVWNEGSLSVKISEPLWRVQGSR